MKRLSRSASWVLFAAAATLCVGVCQQRLIFGISTVSAAVAGAQDQAAPAPGQDPAAANVAPSGPSYTTEAPPAAPAPSAAPGQAPDDSAYAEQPTETATAPPPPLPVYVQPPPPADGYIWTPGYWAWGPSGYYWVPGAWVAHPMRARSGRLAIGGSTAAAIPFIPVTGACTSASMGASTMALATSASATRAAIGMPGDFSTTASTTTWTRASYTTCTAITPAIGPEAFPPAPASMADRAACRFGLGRLKWPRTREPTAPRMSTQVQHAQSYATARGQLAAQNHGRPATASRQPTACGRPQREACGDKWRRRARERAVRPAPFACISIG
jgi:hypothetical protein